MGPTASLPLKPRNPHAFQKCPQPLNPVNPSKAFTRRRSSRHGPLRRRPPCRGIRRTPHHPRFRLRLLGGPPWRRPAPAPRRRRGAAAAPRDAVLVGARDEAQLRRRAPQRHRLRDQVRRGLRRPRQGKRADSPMSNVS